MEGAAAATGGGESGKNGVGNGATATNGVAICTAFIAGAAAAAAVAAMATLFWPKGKDGEGMRTRGGEKKKEQIERRT